MRFSIHTDGGARGNPGPAAIGVVIEEIGPDEKGSHSRVVAEFGKKIGETTNNTAEYTAVIEALKYFVSAGRLSKSDSLDFYLDSTLVVNQLNGLFKVKQGHLRELIMQVRILEAEAGAITRYSTVPREKNERADFFVNQALDA